MQKVNFQKGNKDGKKTKDRLIAAGWTESRNIKLDYIMKKYNNIGISIPKNVSDFLERYGGLCFTDPTRDEDVKFLPDIAICVNLDTQYFERLLEEYDIYEIMYPVGVTCKDNLILVMTKESTFYCYTDGYLEKVGDSIEEMLDCIVGECRKPEVIE